MSTLEKESCGSPMSCKYIQSALLHGKKRNHWLQYLVVPKNNLQRNQAWGSGNAARNIYTTLKTALALSCDLNREYNDVRPEMNHRWCRQSMLVPAAILHDEASPCSQQSSQLSRIVQSTPVSPKSDEGPHQQVRRKKQTKVPPLLQQTVEYQLHKPNSFGWHECPDIVFGMCLRLAVVVLSLACVWAFSVVVDAQTYNM